MNYPSLSIKYRVNDGYSQHYKKRNMTSKEFNEKYKDYLEEGHYGMSIQDEDVISISDKFFQRCIELPEFSYSQIKTKFGTSRVYCEPAIKLDTSFLEDVINLILKIKRENG